MEVSSRHHLRSDEVTALTDALRDDFGIRLEADTYELVSLADAEYDVVLVDNQPLAWMHDDHPLPTIRGANELDPAKSRVTVDAGAVSFVSDGADVMRPGITRADPSIEAGDYVVIDEETHGKVLAIGRARVDGTEMRGDQGKVVDSLHHVGDDLYGFSP